VTETEADSDQQDVQVAAVRLLEASRDPTFLIRLFPKRYVASPQSLPFFRTPLHLSLRFVHPVSECAQPGRAVETMRHKHIGHLDYDLAEAAAENIPALLAGESFSTTVTRDVVLTPHTGSHAAGLAGVRPRQASLTFRLTFNPMTPEAWKNEGTRTRGIRGSGSMAAPLHPAGSRPGARRRIAPIGHVPPPVTGKQP
jgi:hypothetical protein